MRTTVTIKRFLAQRRKGAKEEAKSELPLCVFFAPLRLCARNLLLMLIFLNCRPFILVFPHSLTGHTILTLNPPAEIDKLASLRTERTERIVFPLNWLTAGWALH
jgi:hypothetical protein